MGTACLTGLSLQYSESSEGQAISVISLSRVVCSLQQADSSLDDTANHEAYSARLIAPLLVDLSGLQGADLCL